MNKKDKSLKIFFGLLILIIIGGGVYVFTSKDFEREKPKILIKDKIYWNLKTPINVTLKDNLGIKSYKVALSDGKNRKTIYDVHLDKPLKDINLSIKAPKIGLLFESNRAFLNISVQDSSKWNYFRGNKAIKKVQIIIDKKRPNQFVVAHSYKIMKGGSALVIFKCTDENLKDLYIQTNFGKKFIPQPFYKDGYYISLVAWPIDKKDFRAYVVSEDKAGNISKTYIRYFLLDKRYRTSKIKLKDSFLEGKVSSLYGEYSNKNVSSIEKFKYVNEILRKKNEDLIRKITSKVPKKRVDFFDIKPFYPLKHSAKVASFGYHRYYYYNNKLISEAYHLGIDLASYKNAPIVASNSGKVVYADNNGIYGNMPIIYHGLGLYTLYGHCESILKNVGDEVKRGDIIAKTDTTGLALGDHLHFGVVIQGVEVNPLEWMDRNWIKVNIKDIIKRAKKIIREK